jgi:hypothetical protein
MIASCQLTNIFSHSEATFGILTSLKTYYLQDTPMPRLFLVFVFCFSLLACKPTEKESPAAMHSEKNATVAPIATTPEQKIRFPHKPHASVISCNTCHKGSSGHPELDQSLGHGLCLDCHRKKQRGPTECQGCHIK